MRCLKSKLSLYKDKIILLLGGRLVEDFHKIEIENKKEESMEKRFLIDGAVYKLEGVFFNIKEAIRVLKIASTVIQNASNNISEQGFNPSARISSDKIINIYNNALKENGFEAVRLVRVGEEDDIIIEL